MTESFLNDETKAYLDSLTPNRETICDCSTCGKGLTCADVDAIPPEMFHEDYTSCAECCADEEAALHAAVLTQKVNASADTGPAMKVLMRTQEDGRVEVVMPMGVPPDTRGYNLNRAFQKERVSKVVARLQKKLAAKQTK
jgi:hypothetical protein